MRKTAAVCLALSLLACRWSWRPHSQPHRRIVLFADITMSLKSDAAAAVQSAVDRIIDKAPGGTQLVIVPICENTQGARPIVATVPSQGITAFERQQADRERKALKVQAGALFTDIRNHTHAVTADYASCISPGLRMVENLTRTADSTTVWNTDAIFVSDMIEECRASVLGQPVRLKLPDQQFTAARRLVNSNGRLMDLHDVRVIVILPKAISTTELPRDQPLPADLQAFWQRLFARSGINDKRLWWDADVSQYLDSLRH